MHELSLLKDLMRKITSVAAEEGTSRVTSVHVRLGALSHMSPSHFREHFEKVAPGSVAEGAKLVIEIDKDKTDSQAQNIVLKNVEVEVSNEDQNDI